MDNNIDSISIREMFLVSINFKNDQATFYQADNSTPISRLIFRRLYSKAEQSDG
jgi:hypothetical protein